MVEEEDKPKPEGETSDYEKLAKLREEMKQFAGREKLQPSEFGKAFKLVDDHGKQFEEMKAKVKKQFEEKRAELDGKSLLELANESFDIRNEVVKLAKKENWVDVQPEINERINYLNHLQIQSEAELFKKSIEANDFLRSVFVFRMRREADLIVDDRNLEEREKEFNKPLGELNDLVGLKAEARDKGLSMGEYLQWKTVDKLIKMLFENYKSSIEARRSSAMDSITALKFQAEMVARMLKVEENTDRKQQFKLVVAASIVAGIVVGFFVDSALLVFRDEIESNPVLLVPVGVVLVVVIGLFAFARWAIINRVKKNRR